MEIIALAILIYAVKCAVDDARNAARKSRASYSARYPQATGPRRVVRSVQHDVGYWTAQVVRGFPVARKGFSTGWQEGRQAKAEGKPLPQRSRLIRRFDRDVPAGEAGEGREGTTSPAPQPAPASRPAAAEPVPQAGPAYSYGRAGMRAAWPTDDLGNAHYRARQMSTGGEAYEVHEYPPGGGPGKLLATYRNGREVTAEGGEQPPATQPEEGNGMRNQIGVGSEYEDVDRGIGSMAGSPGRRDSDTTYTDQVNILTGIRDDAEQELSSIRRKRMMNHLDNLLSLKLDSQSLSEAAAIDDALRRQEEAAREAYEAADTARTGLMKRHGGIQEAVDNSPVPVPAEPEFYAR